MIIPEPYFLPVMYTLIVGAAIWLAIDFAYYLGRKSGWRQCEAKLNAENLLKVAGFDKREIRALINGKNL